MSNPIVKAAAGKFGKGIQSLAVEQSVAKTPEIPLDLIIIKNRYAMNLKMRKIRFLRWPMT